MIEVGKLLFHLSNTGYLISAGRGRGTTYSVSHSSTISVNPHHQININGAEINTKDRQTIGALRKRVLEYCKTPHTAKEILSHIERTYQYRNVQVFIKALVEQGKLVPENVNIKRNVKYVASDDF